MSDRPRYSAEEADAALARVRAVCARLPGVTERPSHGSPTFFVKKSFAMFHDDHHGDGILGIWVAAATGVQAEMVHSEPERFYVPPYVGHRGWLGVRLDVDVDWDEVERVLVDAWRCVVPRRLREEFDGD